MGPLQENELQDYEDTPRLSESVRTIIVKFRELKKALQSHEPELARAGGVFTNTTPEKLTIEVNVTDTATQGSEGQQELQIQMKKFEKSLETAKQDILVLKQDVSRMSAEFDESLTQSNFLEGSLRKTEQREESLNFKVKKLESALSFQKEELHALESKFALVSRQLERRQDEELAVRTEELKLALQQQEAFIEERMQSIEEISSLMISIDNLENELLLEKERSHKLEFRLEMKERILLDFMKTKLELSQDEYENKITSTISELEYTRQVLEKKKKLQQEVSKLNETVGLIHVLELDEDANLGRFDLKAKVDTISLISLITDIESELKSHMEKVQEQMESSRCDPVDKLRDSLSEVGQEFEAQILTQLSRNEETLKLMQEAGVRLSTVTQEMNFLESVTDDSYEILRTMEKWVKDIPQDLRLHLKSTEKRFNDFEAELSLSRMYATELETELREKEEILVELQNSVSKLEDGICAVVHSAYMVKDVMERAENDQETAKQQIEQLLDELGIQKNLLKNTTLEFEERDIVRLQIFEQLLDEVRKGETNLCNQCSKSDLEFISDLSEVWDRPVKHKKRIEAIYEIYEKAYRKARSLLDSTCREQMAFTAKLETILHTVF